MYQNKEDNISLEQSHKYVKKINVGDTINTPTTTHTAQLPIAAYFVFYQLYIIQLVYSRKYFDKAT